MSPSDRGISEGSTDIPVCVKLEVGKSEGRKSKEISSFRKIRQNLSGIQAATKASCATTFRRIWNLRKVYGIVAQTFLSEYTDKFINGQGHLFYRTIKS
jgi:hypothetical protein